MPKGASGSFLAFGADSLMSIPGASAVAVLSHWTLCCHCQRDNELGLPRNPTSVEPFDLPSLGVEQSLAQVPLMEPSQ